MCAGSGPAPAPVTLISTFKPSACDMNVAVPLMPEPFCGVSRRVDDWPWAPTVVVAARSATSTLKTTAIVRCQCADIINPPFGGWSALYGNPMSGWTTSHVSLWDEGGGPPETHPRRLGANDAP